MRRLLVAVALAMPLLAVGCQQQPPPQPLIRVCCPHCSGQHSEKCKHCHGHPHDPLWWN